MKRIMSTFMICLALINFSACTNAITATPSGGNNGSTSGNNGSNDNNQTPDGDDEDNKGETNLFEQKDVSIVFLDANGEPTEYKTDSILMLPNNGVKDFAMKSEKTSDNEYRSYLIDKNSGIVISMMYKDMSNFPYRITIFEDGETIFGDTTRYRQKTEDFDMIWYGNKQTESYAKVPLKNDNFNSVTFLGLDANTSYQANTIILTTRIWNAISEYSMSLPSARGWGWLSGLKRIIRTVVAVIIAVVAIVVAVVFPPAMGVLAWAIPTAIVVLEVAIWIDSKVAESKSSSDEVISSTDTRKKLLNITSSNGTVNNGDIIAIPYGSKNTKTILPPDSHRNSVRINFDVPELEIENIAPRVMIRGKPNSSAILNAYFKFFIDNEYVSMAGVPLDGYLVAKGKLNGSHYIIIQKITEIPSDIGEIIFQFEVGDNNVIANDVVLTNGTFMLKIK